MKAFFKRHARFLSGCLGNLFEHYDTAVYSCLTPFLAPLFFPSKDPMTALIYTYALIPLGVFARPLGTILFGYISDQRGRAQALFWSLAGMGILSLMMAACPTCHQIGFFAPLIFGMMRILQNVFAAGETMGGAIFVLEGAPESRRDFLSSIYSSTTVAGILIASAGVSLLCFFGAIEWGWRLLYLIGGLTVFCGLILRRFVDYESGELMQKRSWKECGSVLWGYRYALIQIALVSGLGYACYVMALILPNGLVPLITDHTKEEMSALNTIMLVFDFAIIPLFGWVAAKYSRERLMMVSAALMVITAIPLFALLPNASMALIIGVRSWLVILGVAFCAPFHAWAQDQIPVRDRFLVIAFGSALGSRLLGAPTAAISIWIFQQTKMITLVPIYWMVLAGVSAYFLTRMKTRYLASGSLDSNSS